MGEAEADSVTVGTPTDYGTHSLNAEGVIGIHASGIEKGTAVYLGQQLSLFLETEAVDPFLRTLSTLQGIIAGDGGLAVGVEPVADPPTDCYWPVQVEVEGVGEETVERIVEAIEDLEPADVTAVLELRFAIENAVEESPRSLVRVQSNAGGSENTLEWHTDPDAEKTAPPDSPNSQ